MNFFKKTFLLLCDYRKIILYILNKFNMYKILSDKKWIKIKYRLIFDKKINLSNPLTFNEKIQWLKLNDRNPLHTIYADKFLVREYIKGKIGEEYLIPLLYIYNNSNEIDFDKLPNKFVLKCNHNSGKGMCICKDKSVLDKKRTRKNLTKGLKENYYLYSKEWCYKNIPRKIICEKYMTDNVNGELIDYKFMCFNGEVKVIFTATERNLGKNMKIDFFDINWTKLPFTRHYPSSDKIIAPPKNLKKMIQLASILSEHEYFIRVDFYEINNRIYFGELTFFPGSGFEEFTPEIWDKNLGDMLALPTK